MQQKRSGPSPLRQVSDAFYGSEIHRFSQGASTISIVRAEFTENDFVGSFIETVERGGHSTYMLLMQPAEFRISSYWNLLKKLGCSYESMHIDLSMGRRLLYSVDVPPPTNIHEAYEVLRRGRDQGVWLFQEGYAHLPELRRPTPM